MGSQSHGLAYQCLQESSVQQKEQTEQKKMSEGRARGKQKESCFAASLLEFIYSPKKRNFFESYFK
jgi:hypothetical protein